VPLSTMADGTSIRRSTRLGMPLAVLQVPGPRQHHQGLPRVLAEVAGGALRHALVPQELDLEEVLEVPALLGRMVLEDRPQPLPIGRVVPVDLGRDAGALRLAEGGDATVAHLLGDLRLDVEGDQRDAVLPGEAQDRPVEAVVEAPALEVAGAPQHLLLAEGAGDVDIQRLLEGLLEELHADGEVPALAVQALDDGKLVEWSS
jgi:hypothetical protein